MLSSRPAVRVWLLAAVALLWFPAVAPGAVSGCQPAHVLLDVSRSAEERDPRASTRLEVVRRLAAASGVASVRPFARLLGGAVEVDAAGNVPARALEPDDTGTDLAAVLASAHRTLPTGAPLVLITDADHDAPPRLPARWRSPLLLGVLGERAETKARATGDLAALSERAGPGGRIELTAAADATRLAATAATRWCTVVQAAPVVLIGGLRSSSGEVLGAQTLGECANAGDVRRWCERFVVAGREVWVPPAAPEPSGSRSQIVTTHALGEGARRLANWVQANVGGRRPLLVGHSMGGLFAHAAVARHTLQADGIVTVGTPHAGSYGADAYLAARSVIAACRGWCQISGGGASVAALDVASRVVRRKFGPALTDLTFAQRAVGDRLPALPGNTVGAAYAAGPQRLPVSLVDAAAKPSKRVRRAVKAVEHYAFPNDGIVGLGSALGRGTRFAATLKEPAGSAWHSSSVAKSGAPVQLTDGAVGDWLVRTVAALAPSPGARSARPANEFPRARPARRPRRKAPRVVPRAHGFLVPVLEQSGTDAALPDDALVLAVAPFSVSCGGVVIPAGPAFPDGAEPGGEPRSSRAPDAEGRPELYVLDLATIGCFAPQLTGLAAGAPAPMVVANGSPAGAVTALRRARGGWVIHVRSALRPQLRVAGRRVAVRAATRPNVSAPERELGASGERRWRATISARIAQSGDELAARARVAGGWAGAAVSLP